MSEFVSMAGHELRTPLNHIINDAVRCVRDLDRHIFPRVQSTDPKTSRAMSEVPESLDDIIQEGWRMTALINDMLDLSKIEAGKVERHVQRLSVVALIDREMAANAHLFEEKNLGLVKDCEAELPEVMGDWNQLIRVLENLISNAFKFTEEGSVTCRAIHRDGEVMVSVVDTGRGIAPADLDRIFEKFIQAGDPVTGRSKGTGLGLPIARAIVEQHGGRMWAESEPGQGSAFSFTLPAAPPHCGGLTAGRRCSGWRRNP